MGTKESVRIAAVGIAGVRIMGVGIAGASGP